MESDGASHMTIATDTVCNVCCYTAECIYDGQPMCYLCRENTAKAKRDYKKEMENVTLNLSMSDREAGIIRRALALYAEGGADGCTSECWALNERIIDAQVKALGGQDIDNSYGPDNLSDDADALASAGWGTDEDYGYYGDD